MNDLSSLITWTIGHSTLPWEGFFSLLQANQIECVADVRRFPGSRKYPHFSADTLADQLPRHGIAYLPLPELGGRRKPRADSSNDAWRNLSFRAYADHMETEEYEIGRRKLLDAARRLRTTTLCSEAVWWRCHRGLIADDLKISGAKVLHIMSQSKTAEHPFTSAANVTDGKLDYRARTPGD